MKKLMGALAVTAMLGPAVAHAQESKFHAEVVEWVIEPCMEVAAALDVKTYKAETVEMGIKRTHIAKLMVASRDAATRRLAGQMKASATWEDRRAAYPIMLNLCLRQFTGRK